MQRDNRINKRHKTLGLMSDISDGKSSYMAVVDDISKNGLKIAQIPASFNDGTPQCKAVIHCPSGDHSFTLRPCWVTATNKGMYKTIGFKIITPPAGWVNILKELENGGGELSFLVIEDDSRF